MYAGLDEDNISCTASYFGEDKQPWESDESNDSMSEEMQGYKGKMVMLVESDNPWYLNRDKTLTQMFTSGEQFEKDNVEHFEQTSTQESNQLNLILTLLLIFVIIMIYYKFFMKKH